MAVGETMSNMLGSWRQLDSKGIPFKFLAFCDAYLDSAERLCKVLKRSTRKATYERGAVVLYLTFHSVELFFKACILPCFLPKMCYANM